MSFFEKLRYGEKLFLLTYIVSSLVCIFIVPSLQFSTIILYISFLTVSVFFALLSDLVRNNFIAIFFHLCAFACLGFLMAFRNKTGIDDHVYENIFLYIIDGHFKEIFFKSEIEKGYLIVNYILSFCGVTDYLIVQTVICYLSFVFWAIAFWRYRGKCNLSMMILLLWSNYYFFVTYAGLIRIFMALPIALMSFDCISKKKLLRFCILVLFAAMFHRSALILFLLIPLFNDIIFQNWKTYILALFAIIPIVFLVVAKILVPILGERYSGYGDVGDFSVSVGKFDMLPLWIMALYFFQFVEEKIKKDYIVGIILISLSMFFSIWSSLVPLGRLIFYANLGVVIVASNVFKQKPVGFIELFAPCCFVVYSFFYVMHCSFLNPVSVEYLFPYESYLAFFQ